MTSDPDTSTNGAAMAAYLGAGIGAFAMGAFCVLNESGVFAAPALYGPAGGLSGRAAFACAVWLAAWLIVHSGWRDRHVAPSPVWLTTLILTALGLLGTFPPFWSLF
ncbi:MAG: hypothetical protein AB7P34_00985 [Vicinamibacterales bacterium]